MSVDLKDVRVTSEKYGALDLEKVFQKKIKRVEGFVSMEFGRATPVFELTAVVFEDDSRLRVGGEHDCPYIPAGSDALVERFSEIYKASEEDGE